MARRVLFFSDPVGAAITRSAAPWFKPIGVVMASIRPDHLADMQTASNAYDAPLLVQPRYMADGYDEFVEAVVQLRPDVIFVNSYSMILRDEVLEIPPLGAINIHGGPLPEFRGANPVEWGLIDETAVAGVSAHFIDSGIDSGDLIAVRRLPVVFEDTWQDVRRNVLAATETLLSELLPPLVHGQPLPRMRQDESNARYFKRRKAADGTIPWQMPIRNIHNTIRALVAPHPGTFLEGPMGTAHLSRYHTLPELAAAKFRAFGGDVWKRGTFRLAPVPVAARDVEPSHDDRVVENRSMRLNILEEGGKKRGKCELRLDWRNLSADIEAVAHLATGPDTGRQAVSGLVETFCRQELLRDVAVSFS